jgi:N-acyl-D-aspartate/D-glutamate deacylase
MFDLVIQNGDVADVENLLIKKCHIGIKDGKIAAVSEAELSGDKTIEASGMLVSPGFVDLHMHEDELGKPILRKISLKV